MIICLAIIALRCNENKKIERKVAILQTEDLVFNVGHILKDSTYKFNFYVKSVGDNPLIVDSVSKNCECTNVKFSHKPINKGDSAKFEVTFKANKSDSGKFTSSFVIKANVKNYFVPVYFTGTLID
ncbi:MAG: DUF1573 domain-containing protein [Bacteroidetes bacterium]|nr:DUF1573 domain-containing protein [Bacteroidota bacterium]MCA6443055.1 DUF1573 domain-containing protein [Bacteroidota bacterium]